MITEFGRMLLEKRDYFVTRNAYHSFIGYANSQLKKMEHHQTEGYMGEKRKGLVKKYGYDIPNAAHLIRLLKMGIEFLWSGQLTVYRDPNGDDKNLMSIKRGEWPLEAVKDKADELFEISKQAFEASKLPDEPDFNMAEALVIHILQDYLGKGEII